MYTKAVVTSAGLVIGTVLSACTLVAGNGAATDREFTVAYRVTTRGLDLRQPAGVREFYSRVKHAAEVVCTHGMRVDLKPASDEKACYEKALGDAIRSLNSPLLTQEYLAMHTLQQAAAHGIGVPMQVAAK